MAKMCSFEGDASATSCGKDGFLGQMARMSLTYAGDGLDDCRLDDSGENSDLGTIMKSIGLPAEMLCVKDGETMCYPKYKSLESSGLFNFQGPPTETQLTTMCDPCVLKVLKSMMRLIMLMVPEEGDNANVAAMFDMMCAKDLDVSICGPFLSFVYPPIRSVLPNH
jgi:hypothetical protein